MEGDLSQTEMLKAHILKRVIFSAGNCEENACLFETIFENLARHTTCHATLMTSLRNSIHRRNHKERSQLAHRTKLGILEKHADYVKRARDYHSKQDKLTRLKQKAAEKNKDEFYFSMRNEKTKASQMSHFSCALTHLSSGWCAY